MLKLNKTLVDAVIETARDILRRDVTESTLPEMGSYLVSKAEDCPKGYIRIGKEEVDNVVFHIFQLL